VLDATEPPSDRATTQQKKPQPGLLAEAFGVDGVRLNSSSRVSHQPTGLVQMADQIDPAAHENHGGDSPKKDHGHHVPSDQFVVQTLTVFMPASASDLVL
jgi:hypothetical protein